MAKKRLKSSKKRTSKTNQSKKPDSKMIEAMRRYIRANSKAFLDDPNITSIGIGFKIKNGKQTKDLCLQFTVKNKIENTGTELELINTKVIPQTIQVSGKVVPTDVIERDYHLLSQPTLSQQMSGRKVRVDPIVPGVSVSHPDGTAGTVGLIVYDSTSSDPCMLSNWHVLHGSTGQIGDGIVQPGPFDDNRIEQNHAGVLVRSHLGAAGDCAIARIEDRDFDHDILELNVNPISLERVNLGDKVVKSGRTTGVTRGIVRRIDVIARIAYDGMGPKDIGAFEIEPEKGEDDAFEISMGGDSGSAWLLANRSGNPTNVLVGLHFAGETSNNPDEHALACYAHSVFKKLDIQLEKVSEDCIDAVGLGYDQDFLNKRVPTPRLRQADRKDAFKIGNSHLLHYTHFSVCLSKSRQLPRFVAWNINGKRMKKLGRRGLNFMLDARVDAIYQADNALYKYNNLDRGHIARRADLTWGSLSEAKRANRDSFYYTNIAPQHALFNQSKRGGLWGKLENLILDETDVANLRISVIAGPIFHNNDPIYRSVKIPRDFWKLISYYDNDDNRFKVRAYIITQRDLLNDIEALDLDPFRLFQVSLDRLREETGLSFSAIKDFDTHTKTAGTEIVGSDGTHRKDVREVHSAEELVISSL